MTHFVFHLNVQRFLVVKQILCLYLEEMRQKHVWNINYGNINHTLDYIYIYIYCLSSWRQLFLRPALLQQYADIIHAKVAPWQNCFGFLDGTAIEICQPKAIYQRIVYNGYKRVHLLKVQSLAFPEWLIANLFRSYEGRPHHSILLFEPNLPNYLRQFAWFNNNLSYNLADVSIGI